MFRSDRIPRRASLDAVLSYAWTAGAFTSGDAMPAVGLTRSTTIEAIDDLVELGLLRELPNARAEGVYAKGRPSRRFEFCADAAVVVGIDAGRAHIVTTVADLRGRPLVARTVENGPAGDTAAARRTVVESAVDAALAEVGRARDDVLAVCVGVPAPVDRAGNSPPHRDGFWQRMNADFYDLFAQWVPLVQVENDANLAAIAERVAGAAGQTKDYVALLAGERLGSGIVVDGNLLRGAHGGAGELIAFDHVEGVGEVGGIGYRVAAWARELIAAGTLPAAHPLRLLAPGRVTGRAVLELARDGDAAASALIERAGALLARIAGVFGSLYDPALIIVSGGVASGIDGVIDVAERLLPAELHLPAPRLVASTLGADVVSIGAVSAAVEMARDGALGVG